MNQNNTPHQGAVIPAYYLGRPADVYLNRFGHGRKRRNVDATPFFAVG